MAMTIRLYNTLTRAKDVFRPIDETNVRMYVCGPTVYDDAHIGNARPVIIFDLLFRLLRHTYGADHVTYARNITDLDDKINKRAYERGITIGELTQGTTARFHRAIDALGALRPTVEPRATDHIDEMKVICEKLVASGHAYVAEDHVLFSVPSMPDYGKLSRRPLDDMIAGARVDVAPYKRSEMDFVLWKPSREPHEPGWPSPCGITQAGRPGWHIECSAMSWKHLGEVFDIHGGGIDLVFPHHENEVAQTTCAFGHGVMANVWMHNGFLQVEGDKMSKSLGNFVTIQELLDGWEGEAWPGEVLRLTMMKGHYRQPIDWTVRAMEESWKTLEHWYRVTAGIVAGAVPTPVLDALSDDLNTAKTIAELHGLEKHGDLAGLKAALSLMGFDGARAAELTSAEGEDEKDVARIEDMVAARLTARKAKDFAESDRIRDDLAAMGIQLKDGKDKVTGEPITTWEVAR
ncbi:cysteine--tRNA ligase [Phreatobacter stygius]|uniref:Cysteine--tRNA ligase n=1 Tax=Phreatobacter stygius TaxID=1940610 RepID=A0A4D7B3T2_9HYPH|nr:cysteine--tRNA ligase [Phreatobacter stygius]QCI67551.1 cysteine--tRNA ligase [Phreatobacter stygius]